VAASDIVCPRCGQLVPDGKFCIRCGEPLRDRVAGVSVSRRSSFAAAPGESVGRVALFTTLLPQLPEADLDTFRIAFLGGLVVLLALIVAGAFPVALVGAAVLVPALVLVYVYSVDIYEDTPLAGIALTMLWGIGWGVVFGVATSAILPSDAGFGGNQLRNVIALGVIVPLGGLVVMVIGPLLLLRDRRFNDVMDGATFGVASAVSFVGAQVIAGSLDLFSGGLTPVGESLPWVARIVAIAVALPVVAAGAVGSTAGAFSLRYRAPIRDRGALGVAGRPAVAFVLAGALLVATALAAYLPGSILQVAVQLVLAAIALLWLRRTLHVGLLEEALEIEIGPEIVCANCGATTRRHTFCGNCGIALRALPKGPRPPRP
jgi:ribosomal protein L32